MIFKYRLLITLYFLFILSFETLAVENKILYKVNNEIITSVDIFKETKYLNIINEDLKKFNEAEIYEIAKKSVIREKIREIELILVEKSNRLRKKQKNELKNSIINDKVTLKWLEKLNLKNIHKPIFFYCNEFFDSLPIDQFYYSNKVLYEKRIIVNNKNEMSFIGEKTNKKISDYHKQIKDGSIFEYSRYSDDIL